MKQINQINRNVNEFFWFVAKQAHASIFGAVLLFIFLFTELVDVPYIHRYDFIFLSAIITQIVLIATKKETRGEVLMIGIFHIIATLMELFKTSPDVSSWVYPGDAIFMIATVPLFSGFLYSAVGSYLARAWKTFQFRFGNYPSFLYTVVVAVLIYMNFFTHHFITDIRLLIFVAIIILYFRTRIYFTVLKQERSMSLLVGFSLVSCFIWIAENIGTFSSIWLYPSQINGWELVSIHKLGAWFLLMIVSFVLISALHVERNKETNKLEIVDKKIYS